MAPVITPIMRGVRRLRSGSSSNSRGSNNNRTRPAELPSALPLSSATPVHSALKTSMKYQQPEVLVPSEEAANAIVDARGGMLQKGLSSLDRKSLDSVNDIKNSIKEMRINRHKVKFESSTTTITSNTTATGTAATTTSDKKRTSSPLVSPVPTQSSPTTILPEPPSSTSTSTSSSRRRIIARGLGEITVNDLDIGVSKRQEQLQREIKAVTLQKQINKTKHMIQETSTEVWTERDQFNSLQRKNWSVRKKLRQMEAPEDSVTSLNLKIEKLVRQERIWDSDIDRANEERLTLESECADVANAISQMKYLLDDLHKHVLPLLSTSSSSGEQPPPPAKRNPKYSHLQQQQQQQQLMDTTTELDDTIHSMVGDNNEAPLSSFRANPSNVRILSSASA